MRIFRNAEIPHGGLRHAALYYDANNKSDTFFQFALRFYVPRRTGSVRRQGKLAINVPTAAAKVTAG